MSTPINLPAHKATATAWAAVALWDTAADAQQVADAWLPAAGRVCQDTTPNGPVYWVAVGDKAVCLDTHLRQRATPPRA